MRLWYISVSLAVGSAVRLGPGELPGELPATTLALFTWHVCLLTRAGRVELALVRLVFSTTTTTTVDVVVEHVGRLFGSHLKGSNPRCSQGDLLLKSTFHCEGVHDLSLLVNVMSFNCKRSPFYLFGLMTKK